MRLINRIPPCVLRQSVFACVHVELVISLVMCVFVNTLISSMNAFFVFEVNTHCCMA